MLLLLLLLLFLEIEHISEDKGCSEHAAARHSSVSADEHRVHGRAAAGSGGRGPAGTQPEEGAPAVASYHLSVISGHTQLGDGLPSLLHHQLRTEPRAGQWHRSARLVPLDSDYHPDHSWAAVEYASSVPLHDRIHRIRELQDKSFREDQRPVRHYHLYVADAILPHDRRLPDNADHGGGVALRTGYLLRPYLPLPDRCVARSGR